MVSTMLGFKISLNQEFDDKGMRMPVTYVEAGPCYLTQVDASGDRTSIQMGFGIKKHINKSQTGHIKKAGLTQKLRFLRSFKLDVADAELTPGKEIKVADVFAAGDKISVTGISKGKGFAGVVKRHHFKGGPRTHGQSDRERAPGSIGQTTTPGRVYRGKRMAGRMGTDRVTVRGLTVVGIDEAKNILKIKGVVPGPMKGLVIISKA